MTGPSSRPGTTRQALATPSPAGKDLSGFPPREYGEGEQLYRCHRHHLGGWYFSSDMGGRFDLPAPAGTCYLARHQRSALREALGATLTLADAIPVEEFQSRRVSRLRLPYAVCAADMAHELAGNFGITREISGDEDYSRPQEWAVALHSVAFGGVSYENRFDPSRDAESLALFDHTGPADYPDDQHPEPALDAATACGMVPTHTAPLASLTVIVPPGT